ncbi:hypothetical protein [Massilia horti]|uniref:Uncharacterized protein n=1 Tax=Massilia horti TaxID=2562153 RepID=A0A4Y9T2D4_9BURK|nr:hypothetical protein [Massilia horti]TFW33243.1 hypothetical protein E4O92_07225 [Massilia horti]
MAIFIEGKTRCRICGQVIIPSAVMVGFPNVELPTGLETLADSCLHRRCLDAHPRHVELLQEWQQHWLAQAERGRIDASVNEHGVVIFRKRRFTFAALDSFVVLEDELAVFDQLKMFFISFDKREPASTVTAWNTYELTPSEVGARLHVSANPALATTLRATQESVIIDYEFTGERWSKFALGWARAAHP